MDDSQRVSAPATGPETWWYCTVCQTARGRALSLTAADPACCGKTMIQIAAKELD